MRVKERHYIISIGFYFQVLIALFVASTRKWNDLRCIFIRVISWSEQHNTWNLSL